MLAYRLTRALERAGIPVYGVTIGNDNDRATWRVQYQPTATAQQRLDGDALVQAFDFVADESTFRAEQEQAQFDGNRMVKAVAIWTAQRHPQPLATARQEILAIYRSL